MQNEFLTQKKKLWRKIALCCIAGYLVLAVLFFFLAGDQLHLRESNNNIEMPPANSATIELFAGNVVEQHFTTSIQRLEKISVLWGTYYRPNVGTVVMELYNLDTGALLLSGSFDASTITEASLTTLYAETPLEGLVGVPLMLRVYSPDGQPGTSLSPLMDTTAQSSLAFNYEFVPGKLCFSVTGTDHNWIGTHYWKIVAVVLVVLFAFLLLMWHRQKNGKSSYFVATFDALQKYRFLIRQLVSRDFKTKYKRSVLGMFWSFLNPLLMMLVQYFIFSTLFKSDIPNYAAYLLIGIVCFNFFSEVCNMSLFSILGNASLITKVYMPKYIYPVTRVASSVVNLAISLIPLIIVCLVTGVHFEKSAFLAFFFLICLIIFSMGMGLILSAAMVFFRDTQFLWGIFSTIWMYASAIFYPETILPDNLRFVLDINPVYHFIKNTRICILDGISPPPEMYFVCAAIALVMLLIGGLIFKKNQDKFVLYL